MASVSGNRKTHIMYESGLNLKQLNLYLGELLAHGALEFKPLERGYFITNKGRAFVNAFDHYRELAKILNQDEEALTQFFHTASRPSVTLRDKLPIATESQTFDF